VRIVHSHNVIGNSSGSLGRRGYIILARALLRMFATGAIAPSAASLEDLIGEGWRADPRWRVLPCGIDLAPFRAPIGEMSSRAALRIPADALVLGSVGRLTAEKNSEFLLDVLAAVLRVRPDAYLLLIGDGPLREQLERKAQEGGYRDHLVLPGQRSDVPALLRNVMDVFVFPSPPPPRGNEALGIAVVEAQAAGLKCVISDGLPPEAILIPGLVVQIRSDAGAEKWAEMVIKQAARGDSEAGAGALAVIEKSEHNRAINVKTLAALYRGAVPANT
ncbi:MAG: glycosyltransferase, partial [Bryobacteraceae bacterium]